MPSRSRAASSPAGVGEVAGIDLRRGERIRGREPHLADAPRLQQHRGDGDAVLRRRDCPLLLEQHRGEDQLELRPGGSGVDPDERCGLRHVRRERAASQRQPREQVTRPLGRPERLGVDRGEHTVRQVVAQVPAHAGQCGDDGDPVPLELLGGADPGEQEELGRVDRPGGEHDLARGVRLLLVPIQEVRDPAGATALDEEAGRVRAGDDRQVRPVHDRSQVAVDDTVAPSAEDGDRREPDARVVGGVEVRRARDRRRRPPTRGSRASAGSGRAGSPGGNGGRSARTTPRRRPSSSRAATGPGRRDGRGSPSSR